MIKTFGWKVEKGPTPSINYRTVESQFGDGYKQVSIDGINTKEESYSITVNAYKELAQVIMDFFDEHEGMKSFYWTPPLGKLGLYTCKDPAPIDKGGGLYTITGTFVKTYASMGV